ncbi:tRNA (guanine-N(1)-)-methyltransferase [Geodia barretti]|nr:tRNA (guanine-N(1)-)-methyltransferase [Geodia barretti]
MFREVFDHGIVRRARQAGLLHIETHALTNWTEGRFQRADDAPYGGGPGMVMRVEPLVEAVERSARSPRKSPGSSCSRRAAEGSTRTWWPTSHGSRGCCWSPGGTKAWTNALPR